MNGKMLVEELIEAIMNKQIKIKEVASHYGNSDRTIQSKIKNLGFEWDSKATRYNFVGSDSSVMKRDIDSVFMPVKTVGNASPKAVTKTSTSKPKNNSTTAPKNKVKNTSNNKTTKAVTGEMDNIDLILAGKKEKKVYRGFYLDNDVLSVIDKVDSNLKSKLVNEVLRKVFKEKGLL